MDVSVKQHNCESDQTNAGKKWLRIWLVTQHVIGSIYFFTTFPITSLSSISNLKTRYDMFDTTCIENWTESLLHSIEMQ